MYKNEIDNVPNQNLYHICMIIKEIRIDIHVSDIHLSLIKYDVIQRKLYIKKVPQHFSMQITRRQASLIFLEYI